MRFDCKRDKYRYIKIPVRFICEAFEIYSNTSFCVDTGSPQTIISYDQAVQWKIDFKKLEPAGIIRVAGTSGQGLGIEGSKILLRGSNNKLFEVKIPQAIVLGVDFKGNPLPVPALLGDNVVRQFSLVVESEKYGGRIYLTDTRIEFSKD